LFQTRGCAACHTINGTPAAGKVGPHLTHLASRGVIAGSILENTPDQLREWLKDPPAVKPGSIMPNLGLNNDELDQLVAYLQSLK
jgi:cytochrome c1